MKFMRSTVFSKFVAIATAVIFLNMSFFLTEITVFNLHQDNMEVFERLVKILAGSGLEEEGDSEAAEQSPETLIDLSVVFIPVYDSVLALVQEHNLSLANITAPQNICEITTPPPRFS